MKKLLLISLMLLTITTGTQGSERRIARQKMGCWTLCMLALAHMTGTAADYPLCERTGIAAKGDEWGAGSIGNCYISPGYDEAGMECEGIYRLWQYTNSHDIWLSKNPDMRCAQQVGPCPSTLSSQARQLKPGTYKNMYSGTEHELEGVARDHASCKEYAVYGGSRGKGLNAMPLETFTKNVTVTDIESCHEINRPPRYICSKTKEIPLFAYKNEGKK